MEFADFFSRMDAQESNFFLIMAIASFLLGLLVAWLLRSARISRLKGEVQDAEQRLADAETELHAKTARLDSIDADLERARQERAAALERTTQLENDKKRIYNEVYTLNNELEQLRSTNKEYATRLQSVDTELTTLRQDNEQLSAAASGLLAVPTESEMDESRQPQSYDGQISGRLAELEVRLDKLASENQQLRQAIDRLDQQDVKDYDQPRPADQPLLLALSDEDQDAATEQIMLNPDKRVMGDRIVVSDRPQQGDDLTRIEGIGPYLASQLNQLGVYTYADIAQWDKIRIEQVTAQIGYLPGRIERDNWVGQAAYLSGQGVATDDEVQLFDEPTPGIIVESEPLDFGVEEDDTPITIIDDGADAPTTDRTITTPLDENAGDENSVDHYGPGRKHNFDPTDLKLVEGIGPRLEEILNRHGILSWADLASADPGSIRNMLSQTDNRLSVHDPSTWPLQARLASEGRWDELRDYQRELTGGRDTSL